MDSDHRLCFVSTKLNCRTTHDVSRGFPHLRDWSSTLLQAHVDLCQWSSDVCCRLDGVVPCDVASREVVVDELFQKFSAILSWHAPRQRVARNGALRDYRRVHTLEALIPGCSDPSALFAPLVLPEVIHLRKSDFHQTQTVLHRTALRRTALSWTALSRNALIQGSGASNTTKIPRKYPQERERRRKERKLWEWEKAREILGGPAEGGPAEGESGKRPNPGRTHKNLEHTPPLGPTLRGSTTSSGPHPFGAHNFAAVGTDFGQTDFGQR